MRTRHDIRNERWFLSDTVEWWKQQLPIPTGRQRPHAHVGHAEEPAARSEPGRTQLESVLRFWLARLLTRGLQWPGERSERDGIWDAWCG